MRSGTAEAAAHKLDPGGNGTEAGGSTSRALIETANGSHWFTIRGYSLAKGMGTGKYISSDVFTVGGFNWAIYFYPDGKNPEDNSVYVSVFIALASEGSDVRALFELTLIDQSGKGKHKVHSHFDRALESGPYTLKYQGSMWGYKRFLRRNALEASDYIKDDCLVMKCTVGVVRSRTEEPKQYSILVPPSDMGQSMKCLLESEIGCDIVFKVGDETFKAHKLVLAARSPVFRAQFFGLVGNHTISEIVVEDIDPPIFKAMLLFIYTDTLPEVSDIMDSPCLCTSTIMTQHLLAAADRYGLERLKLLCESKLIEGINPDTVAATLALAEQHQCQQLKVACLEFVATPENLGAVMQSDGYKHLEESCPSLLLELLKTVASAHQSLTPVSSKRSGSSVFGQDPVHDWAATESVNINVRRVKRRVS